MISNDVAISEVTVRGDANTRRCGCESFIITAKEVWHDSMGYNEYYDRDYKFKLLDERDPLMDLSIDDIEEKYKGMSARQIQGILKKQYD
jgi:hypothetical protein